MIPRPDDGAKCGEHWLLQADKKAEKRCCMEPDPGQEPTFGRAAGDWCENLVEAGAEEESGSLETKSSFQGTLSK